MNSKVCKICLEEKDTSFFYKNPGGYLGVRATCKSCEECKRKTVYKPADKERQLQAAREYRSRNYSLCLSRTKEWRRNNLQYDAYRARMYRARKQQQLPSWADLDKIKEIYLSCPKGYHVDHIIPLKGILACGLHVETNLQHLPAKENLQKRNLFGWDNE